MKVFAHLGCHPKHCPFKNVARSDTGSCMAEAMRLVDGRSTFHTLIAAYTLQRAPLTATLAAQHVCEAQRAQLSCAPMCHRIIQIMEQGGWVCCLCTPIGVHPGHPYVPHGLSRIVSIHQSAVVKGLGKGCLAQAAQP